VTTRILIHRPGSLGDTVVALPCFHLIRRSFPDSELRVLTNAPVADGAPQLSAVLDGSGLIDGYFEYPASVRDGRRLWRLARAIRQWHPTTAVYLVPRRQKYKVLRDAAFLRLCGIKNIIGLPLVGDSIEFRRRSDGLLEREAERLARWLAPLGMVDARDRANWDLRLSQEELASARSRVAEVIGGHPFIALCIGTKQVPNDWGIGNWHALVEGLRQECPHKLVLVGGEGDRELSEAIARNLPDRCINLCGSMGVRESAALIASASLFIGCDSGPMHLASAVGTPLVAIFSKLNDPGIWFPFGKNVRVLYPYADNETNQSILPIDVLMAAKDLLNPAGES